MPEPESEILEPECPSPQVIAKPDERQMRHKFLSKLVYSGMLNKGADAHRGTRKSQNLTIFDWDDTFFPTSAFNPRYEEDMKRIGEQNSEMFKQLDLLIVTLLRKT